MLINVLTKYFMTNSSNYRKKTHKNDASIEEALSKNRRQRQQKSYEQILQLRNQPKYQLLQSFFEGVAYFTFAIKNIVNYGGQVAPLFIVL